MSINILISIIPVNSVFPQPSAAVGVKAIHVCALSETKAPSQPEARSSQCIKAYLTLYNK